MSFDMIVLKEWHQTVTKEDIANDESTGFAENPGDRPIGPYETWEMTVVHPIEQRNYHADLKNLGSHWRMRVYYKTIRDGLRFTKVIDASGDTDEAEEQQAKFLATKYLHRYFQEQLAMYNAICILHLGHKYTEICDCEDKDHSQHLADEFKPIEAYDGTFLRRTPAIEMMPSRRVNRLRDEGITEEDMCDLCLGDIDIEACIRYGLCPVCRSRIPHPDEYLYGNNYDVTDEFLKWRKERYDALAEANKETEGDDNGEEGSG